MFYLYDLAFHGHALRLRSNRQGKIHHRLAADSERDSLTHHRCKAALGHLHLVVADFKIGNPSSAPAPWVAADCIIPVPTFVTTTDASGIDPPDASDTVPRTVAVVPCAATRPGVMKQNKSDIAGTIQRTQALKFTIRPPGLKPEKSSEPLSSKTSLLDLDCWDPDAPATGLPFVSQFWRVMPMRFHHVGHFPSACRLHGQVHHAADSIT